jgi:signal transduction histidine kinase
MVATSKQAAEFYRKKLLQRTTELKIAQLELVKKTRSLETQNRHVRTLSARLLHAQDEERRRIARELHDSLGQGLVLLSFDLSKLRSLAKETHPALGDFLAEKLRDVQRLAGEVRSISYLLHPPLLDEMGLSSALRCFVEGFQERCKIRIDLQISKLLKRLPLDLETMVFRVIQECLTNVYRHSGSPTASIRLATGAKNKVSLTVVDRGKGIEPDRLRQLANRSYAGLGLRGIAERLKVYGGQMEILSDYSGTTVRVTIPSASASPA